MGGIVTGLSLASFPVQERNDLAASSRSFGSISLCSDVAADSSPDGAPDGCADRPAKKGPQYGTDRGTSSRRHRGLGGDGLRRHVHHNMRSNRLHGFLPCSPFLTFTRSVRRCTEL